MRSPPIAPAGWPLRHFALDDFASLLNEDPPNLIELSKDFLRQDVSLKALANTLAKLCASGAGKLCFAGTTDLVRCAGLSWERYRRYLAVQIAQAKFLECSLFRLLLGDASPDVSIREMLRRVQELCHDIDPLCACIEIHAGAESDTFVLAELLRRTPVKIIVDLGNMHHAGLTVDELTKIIPADRIAYFHQRNLPGVWTEHPASLEDEIRWREIVPDGIFLWEPKKVDDPTHIRTILRDYRTSH